MTKEQLIKEFRERFTFQKGGVWMDGKTYMVPFEIQAFLLSAFDAGEKNGIEIGRASGIEEVKKFIRIEQVNDGLWNAENVPAGGMRMVDDVYDKILKFLTTSSSKDN